MKLTDRVKTIIPFTAAIIESMSYQPFAGPTEEAPSVESADPVNATVSTKVAGTPVSA